MRLDMNASILDVAWLELLRAVAPTTSALVVGCGTEAIMLSNEWRIHRRSRAHIACLFLAESDDAKRAQFMRASWNVEVLPRLPPSDTSNFGLLLVPSRYWHSQRSPSASLRRLGTRLKENATALVAGDSPIGRAGLAHARAMASLT